MTKYIIKISKIDKNEGTENEMSFNMRGRELDIFNAEMDSDSAIEILQHLHDIKERKIKD